MPDEQECKFTCDYSVEHHLISHLGVIWIKLVTWIVLYFVDKKKDYVMFFIHDIFLKHIPFYIRVSTCL